MISLRWRMAGQNIARALLGHDEISDPYGEARSAADESGIERLINKLQGIHSL